MMWSWEKKNSSVDVAEKTRQIDALERELTRLGNALAEERLVIKTLQDATRSSSFAFDFTAVKAFSVERNLDAKNLPVTIIGYLLPEPVVVTEDTTTTKDVVREWYLHCDEKQHEAIVKAFKESIK